MPTETQKIDGADYGRPLTAPAGLTRAVEKLSARSADWSDVHGLAVTCERIQRNINRYLAKVAAVMPPEPPASSDPDGSASVTSAEPPESAAVPDFDGLNVDIVA